MKIQQLIRLPLYVAHFVAQGRVGLDPQARQSPRQGLSLCPPASQAQ